MQNRLFSANYAILLFVLGSIMFLGLSTGSDNSDILNQNVSNDIENTSYSMQDDWKAPALYDKLTNPLTDIGAALKKGKEFYYLQCATCHGDEGTGDGIAGMGLNPRPADLTSEKVQSQSDGAIFYKITSGRAPMASYKEMYTNEQRWQLVTFIRSLKK